MTTQAPEAPNPLVEMAQQLDDAAKSINSVAIRMDRHTDPCECCGRSSARNLMQWKAGDALDNVVEKLHRWAGALRDGRDMAPNVTAAREAEEETRRLAEATQDAAVAAKAHNRAQHLSPSERREARRRAR